MIRIFVIVFLLSTPVMGQDISKLNGIGDFKINQTHFDSVESLVNGEFFALYNHQTAQYAGSFLTTSKLPGAKVILLEVLKPESPEDQQRHGITFPYAFVDGYRHLCINHYDIGDVAIRSVQLLFKNDTLIRFHSDFTNEIAEAFRLKYGEDGIRKTTNKVICRYKLTGNTEELEESIISGEWTNGPIKSYYGVSTGYDDKCNKEYLTWFYIEDSEKVGAYNVLVKAKEAEIAAAKLKMKEEKLKKF